jgi:hypothetical protein
MADDMSSCNGEPIAFLGPAVGIEEGVLRY